MEGRDPASFRDPSGFVFREGGVVLRQVNALYRDDFDRLVDSGLCQELIAARLLIPHEDVTASHTLHGDAYKILRPEPLAFVSYPYEWSFGALKAAALCTLAIQRAALAKGLTLKDASAYNVQLHRGRPVFIDTLSFERWTEGEPWVAYRQFCQHFLAPLALMSRVDVRLGQLLRIHIDGIPLDLASRLLPTRTRLSVGLGLHLHAHARTQRRHAADAGAASRIKGAFSRRSFDALIDGLRVLVEGLEWKDPRGDWTDYYSDTHNYGADGLDTKATAVRAMVEAVRPAVVWDLGANTGRFSRIAVEAGARLVVAWDVDPACVERNWRQVVDQKETVLLPLLLDLMNPSPGIGWAHEERRALADRGPVDLLLALGLVHHLAIANNVPLGDVAGFLARLGRAAIIEWVPKEDSQVQRLLAGRKDVFPGYEQAAFEEAFGRHFTIEARTPLAGTQRTLYRLRTRSAP